MILQPSNPQSIESLLGATGDSIGFGANYQQREVHLAELPADGSSEITQVAVRIRQIAPSTYSVSINDTEYPTVTVRSSNNVLTSHFPHTRLATTVIRDGDRITLFQRGKQYRLQLQPPKWVKDALGVKDVTNSVLAPMPCKVLRVEVSQGDEVRKDQALVVIESMKMETVIRSPVDGKVARVVHGAGDVVKAGTALVEFEEAEG
ncbi:hypothetical protein LTS18_003670 [Coniosporium uncinatum]|uniref:Uncharacterized protein n=1 Tax=Coniosporium uncinatum TaxID=93489 RepID=A0ACC3D6K1_9PEZI|nr:hypothetical protein LTS18_003670 [Coniosporium uncinatum]